jgi:hypothetical protein
MVWVFRSLFGDLGFFTVVILRWVWWFIYGIIMVFFWHVDVHVTRVNSTNALDEGLRIGGIGRRMNSKVKSVKQGVYRK